MWRLSVLAVLLATAGCRGMTTPPGSSLLAQAVAEREIDRVRSLLADGTPPDSTDERGQTALVIATETDQFRIANMLLDHRANIWFVDSLGFTPGIFAENSNIADASDEGRERLRFIFRLREAGYPWPPPNPLQTRALASQGRWPPPR